MTWLRDPCEDDRRKNHARDLGRPLDAVEMLKLFLRWEGQQSAQMELGEGPSNIINHRLIVDLGGFMSALDAAQEIVLTERANNPLQARLLESDPKTGLFTGER